MGIARWLSTHKKVAVIVILLLSLGSSLGTYEAWRSSVESQILSKVDFMNRADGYCSYIISNSFVLQIFDGRSVTADFTDGGTVNKTQVADWTSVLAASATVRQQLIASSLPCKMFFGLTRTSFILLGQSRERPSSFFTTQDVVFTTYAPF